MLLVSETLRFRFLKQSQVIRRHRTPRLLQILFQVAPQPPSERQHISMHTIYIPYPRERRVRELLSSITCFGSMVGNISHRYGLRTHANAITTGRTRFTQARAELGMTDRTGGPSSPNYVHRRRPENYEEEDDENSEGEDVVKLKARAGGSNHPPGDDEEDRLHAQDLTLARSLRLRAEGLEKVVTSMLGQPPTCHPINDEDIWTPPTSPKMDSSYDSKHHHLHTLPNGVRLRLALGTIINDLFARQAPSPPYRHQFHPKSPSEQSPASSSSLLTQDLPLALSSLSTICATHSGSTTPRLMSHPSSSNYPSYPPQVL